MRESVIESRLRREIERLGCICWKFVSPGCSGVPDRIVLIPGGHIIFVETKAPGRRERALQTYVQGRMRGMGCVVFSSVDSPEKVREVCDYIEKVKRDERV